MTYSNQFSAMNAQFTNMLNTSVSLMTASIDGLKQATLVQCEAMRTLVQESANTAKAICMATTPSQAANCMQEFTTKSVEACIAKGQELSGIMKSTKSVFSDATSSTVKTAQQSLVKSVNQLSAVNPAFSKAATESLESWISTSNQAADTASKVSAQVAEVASKNIEAATQATLNTVIKASASAN